MAANVNRAILAARGPDPQPPHPFSVPGRTAHHWRGIRARIAGFDELRAARIDSGENPAHPLANAPDQYEHVNREPKRCVLPDSEGHSQSSPEERYPPPSRADRKRSTVGTGGEPASD